MTTTQVSSVAYDAWQPSNSENAAYLSYSEFLAASKGQHVLFVCVGTDSTKYEVYEHIKMQLGVHPVILDVPGCQLAKQLDSSGVATYLELDMTPRSSLVTDAVEVVSAHMTKANSSIGGVTTLWDDAVCLAARLQHYFGLTGNSPKVTDLAHDKAASRNLLYSLGYPSPKSMVVKTLEEVKHAKTVLTFPAIMKPLYGAASIGVRKVKAADQAEEAYLVIQKTLDAIYAEGELMGLTFEDVNAGIGSGPEALRALVFEEFVDGHEFDCDVVLLDGEVVYCNVMDDWEFVEPHFIEIGSSCPSTRPKEVQEEVKSFSLNVLRDMGFRNGVFHVEVIHSARVGPILIEVNPRMGGGPVRSIHRTVYGVDLANFVVCSALGLKMKPEVVESTMSAVTINLFARKSGTLTRSISECQSFLNDREDIVSKFGVGDKKQSLVGWYDGHPSALGRVNFMMDMGVQEAVAAAKDLIESFYDRVSEATIAGVD